jgi:phage-related protein
LLEMLVELLRVKVGPGILAFLQWIGQGIVDGLTALGDFFIWLGNQIKEMWDFLVKHVRGAMQNIGDRIHGVINFFVTLPDRILTTVANFGSLLYNAGVNLIQGLLRGIRDHIPGLKGLLNWVTSMLPDWKGPEDKDRRILYPAGQAVMSGFVTGINAGKAELRDALTGITQSLAGSATSTTNSQSVNFGPGAINISFMGNPTPDQAYQTGQAVGAGINSQLETRNVTLGVRRM